MRALILRCFLLMCGVGGVGEFVVVMLLLVRRIGVVVLVTALVTALVEVRETRGRMRFPISRIAIDKIG